MFYFTRQNYITKSNKGRFVAANVLNKQWRTADKGWSFSLGGKARCWQRLTITKDTYTKCTHEPRTWTDTLVRHKRRKTDNWDVGMWTGSSWLRIGTGGRHLWMRYWTFGFHTMRGNSWLAENRLAYQEGLCCMACKSKERAVHNCTISCAFCTATCSTWTVTLVRLSMRIWWNSGKNMAFFYIYQRNDIRK